MFALTAAIVAAGAAFNYAVNPYGAWSSRLVNPVYRDVDQERVVTPYLLRSARPATILLGSSRVLMGMRIEQGMRDGVMNAALSAANLPQLENEISVALENPALKRIVWGVDFFSFDTKWNRPDPNINLRLAGSRTERITDALLSLSAVEDGYDLVRRAMRGPQHLAPQMRIPVPWPMPFICERFASRDRHGLQVTPSSEVLTELVQDLPDYATYQLSAEAIDRFRVTVNAARARGVEVLIFVPPMSRYELELIRQAGRWDTFQDWKRRLAAVGPYVDFSGYDEMSKTDAFFMHVMHFKTAVGNLMLRIILGDDIQDCNPMIQIVRKSALRVDESNIDHVLAMQDLAMRMAAGQDSTYTRIAAQALARRAREPGAVGSGS
jgi:hypothetical protein